MTMRKEILIACALAACSGAVATAQDKPQTPATPAPSTVSDSPKGKPFIRRFSAGGVLSFSGFKLMENLSKTEVVGTKSTVYSTTSKGSRLGGGATVQGMITSKFGVTASALLRRVNFETNADTTDGTKTSKTNDVSSADFWEFPILLRRYSKGRMDPGARWFGEGGLALRRVRNVRSSLQTTGTDAKVVCCDERPIPVAKQLATGFAVGGGYHFVDQFGIRFIPSIRYTRWSQSTFDRQSIRSNKNQIEAILSITF